jgi:Transglutaminase-like superfamily
MSLLKSVFRRPRAERILIAEATLMLVGASVALALLPFRRIVRTDWQRPAESALGDQERQQLERAVARAVQTVSAHLPWRTVCFHEGLSVLWMLRRRGIPVLLWYGARTDEHGSLSTHVWVMDGDAGVIGHQAARDFTSLAAFPPNAASASASVVHQRERHR